MKKYSVLFVLFCMATTAFAQLPPERHDMRKGNKAYKSGDYRKAEVDYRHGLEKDSTSFGARYNLADALYKQEQYDKAEELFGSLKDYKEVSDARKAQLFHNLGNAQLQQKKYDESVKSYKQSMRLNPTDTATRANLAYAQLMLQKQQQQQPNQGGNSKDKDQQDQDKNKNNQENQDNKDDKQDQKDNKDQQQNQDQKQDSKDNKQDQQNQQPQQQPKISPQDAQRMLEAVQADEKDTQEKVKKEKAKAAQQHKIEKNW